MVWAHQLQRVSEIDLVHFPKAVDASQGDETRGEHRSDLIAAAWSRAVDAL